MEWERKANILSSLLKHVCIKTYVLAFLGGLLLEDLHGYLQAPAPLRLQLRLVDVSRAAGALAKLNVPAQHKMSRYLGAVLPSRRGREASSV